MSDLRNDILTTEAKDYTNRLIGNGRGIVNRADDMKELHDHMAQYLRDHQISEAILREVAIDNLIDNVYKSRLNSAARSKKSKQGDLFGAGLPEVILIKGTDTYIRFEMARDDQLNIWIDQKRSNVRAAQEALYLDEDYYKAIIDEMNKGAETAGEAIAAIRLEKAGKEA